MGAAIRTSTNDPRMDASDVRDLDAYNAAFEALGFDWHWEPEDYQALLPIPDERERIGVYLRSRHPHLLTAYDLSFLCEAICVEKSQRALRTQSSPHLEPRRTQAN